ncbi:MAG: glycosyltransferase [Clostridiales bacterium]|nr:glycosyltransferase [Clostridiales bacterium]
MNELVSVIIPVYNVEKYLNTCLESVVGQSYRNIEIILINDGSKDKSGEICDEWAKKDDRIKVVHQDNAGVAAARNRGLLSSNGLYIAFIDADDKVQSEYIAYLVSLLRQYDADITACSANYMTEEGYFTKKRNDKDEVVLLSQRDALYELCSDRIMTVSVWGKLFKKTLFEGILFPFGEIFEDLATTYKLFLKAEKIILGKKALYDYIRHEHSIMTSFIPRKRLKAISFAEEMKEGILQKHPELEGIATKRAFAEYVYTYRGIVLNKYDKDTKILLHDLYIKIKEQRGVVWKENISLKFRCYIICSWFGKKALEYGLLFEEFLTRKLLLRK